MFYLFYVFLEFLGNGFKLCDSVGVVAAFAPGLGFELDDELPPPEIVVEAQDELPQREQQCPLQTV